MFLIPVNLVEANVFNVMHGTLAIRVKMDITSQLLPVLVVMPTVKPAQAHRLNVSPVNNPQQING